MAKWPRTLIPLVMMFILVWGAPLSEADPAPGSEGSLEPRLRARELGIVVGRDQPGPFNAITDVSGVKVGHVTLIRGHGVLKPGEGPACQSVVRPFDPDSGRRRVLAGQCHGLP